MVLSKIFLHEFQNYFQKFSLPMTSFEYKHHSTNKFENLKFITLKICLTV